MKLRWLLAFLVADVLWVTLGVTSSVPWSVVFPVLVAVALVAGTGLLTDLEKPRKSVRQEQHGGSHSVNVQAGRDIEMPGVTPVQKQEPLPVVGIDVPDGEYVPDGQDALSASLLEFLWDQVKEAEAHRIGPQRAWHVSPEWLEEVARIRQPDGKPAWAPRKRVVPPGKLHTEFLFGYPVITGDALGPPELREL